MTENINQIKKSPSKAMGILAIILAILSLAIGFFKAPEFVLSEYYDGNNATIVYVEIYYVLIAVAYALISVSTLRKTDKKLVSNKLLGVSMIIFSVAYTICMLPIFTNENLSIYYVFTPFLMANGLILLPITIIFAIFLLNNKNKAGKTGLNATYFVFNICYSFFYMIDCFDLMEEKNTLPSGFVSLLFVGVLIAFTIMLFIKIKKEIPKKAKEPKPVFAPQQPYMQHAPAQPRVERFDPYTGKPLYQNEPKIEINENGEKVITPAFSSSPSNIYKNEKQEIENVKVLGEKIVQLKKLYENGAISEQEYLAKKAELMAKL